MIKRFFSKLPFSAQAQLTWYRSLGAINSLRFSTMKAPSNGWPILLGLSFPKSGTHLLSQILQGFSTIAPFSYTPLTYSPAKYNLANAGLDDLQNIFGSKVRDKKTQMMMNYLNKLRPLDITRTHLHACPEVVDRVCSPDFLPYFIYRDPRDISVSLVYFITKMDRGHRLHHHFSENLKTFDERLFCSFQGVKNSSVRFDSIAQRFENHLGWLDQSQVLSIRFEDIINNRQASLGLIADHFLKRVDTVSSSRDELIALLENSINPSKSPTFRSGKTGEWKKYFTDEHKRAFKDVAGDLLIKLGYEKDGNW